MDVRANMAHETFTFRDSSSLGGHSARIDLCYAMGLLPKMACRDLRLIGKIRNRFGHVASPLAFDDSAIADQCRELHHTFAYPDAGPRGCFTSAALGVCGIIHARLTIGPPPPVPRDIQLDKARRAAVRELAESLPERGEGPEEVTRNFLAEVIR